jgi:hypothetical protein
VGASNVATYTCSITGTVAGTYSATAAYPGDSNYNSASGSNSTASVVAQTIGQGSPTSDSTSTTGSSTYIDQLNPASGYVGAVTWTQTTGAADLQGSSSGAVTTTGYLAAGIYIATGTTSDGYGDSGTFTFSLTVVAQTIGQGLPTSDSTSTTSSSTYIDQLNPASGYVGAVTWSQTTGAADLQGSSSGAVTTTGYLAAGIYIATGTTSDGYGDSGTWSFTLTVKAGAITQGGPTTGAALPAMLSELLLAAGILLVLVGTLFYRRGKCSGAGQSPTLSS